MFFQRMGRVFLISWQYLRIQVVHNVFVQAFCANSGVANPNLENICQRILQTGGDHVSRTLLPHGFPAMCYLGMRMFSLMPGEGTGDGEADDEGHEDLSSEPEVSEDESEVDKGVGNDHLGVSIYGQKFEGEKTQPALFKVLVEAPFKSVISVLDKWVGDGNRLNRNEISTALRHLRTRRLYGKALQLTEWLERSKRINFTEQEYVSHLELIAKVHGINKAEMYIDRVPESFKSEVIYEALLANCVCTNNIMKAEEVFKKIKEFSLPITVFACNQLLLVYKRNGGYRNKIADVLVLMEKENIKPSPFTYKLLVDAKGRSCDITGLEQILETMKTDGVEPDTATRAMIAGYYIAGGLTEKAGATLKEMEGGDIVVNRNACRYLLPLYAALGKTNDVQRIWKVCEANPSMEDCLSAIQAWGKLGHVNNAENIFKTIPKISTKVSAKGYNALLNVYADHKLLSKGKKLARRMSDDGCRIDPQTWDALVRLYAMAGEVEKADSILQKATRKNVARPLHRSFMTTMEQYAKRGDVHNSEKILHGLKRINYPGRMTPFRPYQLLLEAYVNAKAPAYGLRERMKADNVVPTKQMKALLAAIDDFTKAHVSEAIG